MAANLGDFFVNITTKVKDTDAKKLASTLGSLTKSAAKIGTTFAASIAAASYGFAKLIGNTALETAELGRLSKDLGVSADFLQIFTRSFETVGAGADEAINTIRTLKTEIESFKIGKGNFEAFGMLGLNPQSFGNDVSKNFDVVRKRFGTLTDAQRLYWVTQIGLGEKSLRVLRLNDKEYNDLIATSRRAPLATDKQIKDSERYTQNINKLSQSFEGLKRSVLVSTLPTFEKFLDRLDTLFQDKKFQDNIGKFFDVLFGQLEKLVDNPDGAIDKLEKLSNALGGIATAIQAIGMVVNGFVQGSSYIGQKIADLIDSQIDNVFLGKGRKDKAAEKNKQSSFNTDTSRLVTQNSGMSNSSVVNNFNNKTDIRVETIKDTEDFKKQIPRLLEESFMSSANKMSSQNFKKGVIR